MVVLEGKVEVTGKWSTYISAYRERSAGKAEML